MKAKFRLFLFAVTLMLLWATPAHAQSLVQVNSANAKSLAFKTAVTKGNLLFAFGVEGSNDISALIDTQANVWASVALGTSKRLAGCAIAKASGSDTVSFTDTGTNNALTIYEISGASGCEPAAVSQTLAAAVLTVNNGPATVGKGALTFLATWGQATGYTSTSGSTLETAAGALRLPSAANFSAVGSYTETGKLAGSLQYGATIYTIGLLSTAPAPPPDPPATVTSTIGPISISCNSVGQFTMGGLTFNCTAVGTNHVVYLTWQPSTSTGTSAATGYNVYRGTVSGGPYSTKLNATPLALSNLSYQDGSVTSGATYYYVVTAVNATGESSNSSQATAVVPQ